MGTLALNKKENKIFLIYEEIQMGAVAKAYTRKAYMTLQKLPSGFHYI
jgi:hypothetical protein